LWNSSQPRLLIGIELIFLVLLILSGALFYLVANRDLTASYYQAHLRIRNVQDILLPTLVLVNLGGLLLGAILTVFFTHRISGPVYRVCRVLRQVGEGNVPDDIRFRESDELKDLEKAVSDMLSGLKTQALALQVLAAEARVEVDAAVAAHPELRGQMSELQRATVALEEALGEGFPTAADLDDACRECLEQRFKERARGIEDGSDVEGVHGSDRPAS
jgi:methyl-accepting chemotaxis protein